VLGFVTTRRTGRCAGARLQPTVVGAQNSGVATSTVARRLSIVSGFFASIQAWGDIAANPVPRGLPTPRERSRPARWCR
jgi:site-specific recombinase XerC